MSTQADLATGTGDASIGRCIRLMELLRKEMRMEEKSDKDLSATAVLAFLYVAQFPGITTKAVERLAKVSKNASSRHLRMLTGKGDPGREQAGAGFIEIAPTGTRGTLMDDRQKPYQLTSKGLRLVREINKVMEV